MIAPRVVKEREWNCGKEKVSTPREVNDDDDDNESNCCRCSTANKRFLRAMCQSSWPSLLCEKFGMIEPLNSRKDMNRGGM